MISKRILVLILVHLNAIYACDVFQTKRTCECTATYTYSNEQSRTLFVLPSYDDCGINLGCEKLDCSQKCLNKVREVLGGRPDYITASGLNKVCDLVTSPLRPTILANSSIRVWAAWKYSSCRSGIEPVVQDVCCNRKCTCRLVSQHVSSAMNDFSMDSLADLTPSLAAVDGPSYQCSLDLMATCQDECMNVISVYFNNLGLKKPEPKKLNFDMFANDRAASDKVCALLGQQVTKPGTDVYVQMDLGESGASKFLSLGRVCCRSECKCEYVFREAFTNKEVRGNYEIGLVEPFRSLGYECSNGLSDCLEVCRRSAFSLINIANPDFKYEDSLSELDTFRGNNVYKKFFCDLINKQVPSDKYGFNIYIRYSAYKQHSPLDKYPYKEDLHVGRLCCQWVLNNFIGVNRCDYTDP